MKRLRQGVERSPLTFEGQMDMQRKADEVPTPELTKFNYESNKLLAREIQSKMSSDTQMSVY